MTILLSGCGTPWATVRTDQGDDVMLQGHDPVAYFTDGKPVHGKRALSVEKDGRTYWFASEAHRSTFAAAPAKYEPQYGGFCANGAAYNVKLGSDPHAFEVRDGRLFIFGDVMGREYWLLDPATNIAHADALWPAMADTGWRWQTLKGWTDKVPWYRTGPSLKAEWQAKHPGQVLEFDPGSPIHNLFFRRPPLPIEE